MLGRGGEGRGGLGGMMDVVRSSSGKNGGSGQWRGGSGDGY